MDTKKKLVFVRSGIIRPNLMQWFEVLNRHFDLTILILDIDTVSANKNVIDKFKTININYFKNLKLVCNLINKIYSRKLIKRGNYDICVISSSRFSFLLPLLNKNTKYVYMTGHCAISKNLSGFIWNFSLFLNMNIFKNLLVTNLSPIKKFKVKEEKIKKITTSITRRSQTYKKFNEIDMLYVGTLNYRNIHETIQGFAKFYQEYKNIIDIKYTIIGTGLKENIELINKTISIYQLENVVDYKGWIEDHELQQYFDMCNIGVGYIPIINEFTNNFSFKVMEFLLSGMPVIATNTNTNKMMINKDNGTLVEDTALDFYEGLKEMFNKLNYFKSEEIYMKARKYDTDYVVTNEVIPYLNKLR